MTNYILIIISLFICSSCVSIEARRLKLENKGLTETHIITETNNKKVLVYFKSGFTEIISKMDLPILEEKVSLHYQILIDLKFKSIVSFKRKEMTDNISTIKIGSEIGREIFKKLKIKTKNIHLFNPFKRNIRKERIMAYVGVKVELIGSSIYVDGIMIRE